MILNGNARRLPLADQSVQCVITSPPYYGLRDYSVAGQIGLEPSLDAYLETMVEVFAEVWRVLRDDGTVWVNMGDSYAGSWGNSGSREGGQRQQNQERYQRPGYDNHTSRPPSSYPQGNLKPKDLMMVPHRLAIALQDTGWYMRQEIVWHKPNPMPESCRDRCTRAYEFVFMLTKRARYFYDGDAIREEEARGAAGSRFDTGKTGVNGNGRVQEGYRETSGRNRRSVWTVPTAPFAGAHFATFPPDLIEPMILAGTSARGCCPECGAAWERVVERQEGKNQEWTQDKNPSKRYGLLTEKGLRGASGKLNRGTKNEYYKNMPTVTITGWRPTCAHDRAPVPCVVLDPFAGSGTVGQVCRKHDRVFVGVDLSLAYLREIALPRAENTQTAESLAQLPLFAKDG